MFEDGSQFFYYGTQDSQAQQALTELLLMLEYVILVSSVQFSIW